MATELSVRVVSPEHQDERLDRFLAAQLGELTRSQIKRAIDSGSATVDGVVARAGQRLKAGQRVQFTPAEPPPSTVEPEQIPLDIVYEDDEVVVVNKGAGMVVHPAAGNYRGTLVAALLGHCALAEGGEALRPGIVHRLDKDTTGLMVVAKTQFALSQLGAQWSVHSVGRQYLALARGKPPERGTRDTDYGRHPRHRIKFSSKVDGPRRAVTHFEVVERFGSLASLVRCTLETGRTHQVRVHLSDLGFPLLGDELYGGTKGLDKKIKGLVARLGRQALHATHLAFDHPRSGERLELDAPLPADMQEAVELLRRLV